MLKKLHLSKNRMISVFCFFMFCLIDQRIKTGSGLDGWIETFRYLAGAVMAVLILSHYQLKDFYKQKIPYLLWSLICVIGGVVFLQKGQPLIYFLNARIAMLLSVFLIGICVIRTIWAVLKERQCPKLNRKFACIWLVMMIWMILSRSTYLWPLAYLIMFGCFYLTDYTAKEQEELFHGMLDGIILAFFLLQGWCFAFRPYDAVRYRGVYNNSNMNALFYLLVLAAALAKLVYTYRRGGSRVMKLFYFAGTGVVLGFIFMTIGRTAWLVAAIVVLIALLYLWRVTDTNNIFISVLKNGLLVVACFILMFPLVFGAVRYLPPVFHHPVWFYGEWKETKVHSWDKWDSEKFVGLERLLSTSVGRVADVFEGLSDNAENEDASENGPHLEVEGVNMVVEGDGETATEITPLQQQLYDQAYAAGYAIDPADRKNPVIFRTAIYRFYAHLLNVTGHPESEQGFQILPDHRIGHAHNIYLQYGVDFGIPAMLLFAVLVVWTIFSLTKRAWKERMEYACGNLLILLVPALFGLLEYAWGSGSATVILLFIVWRRMVCDEREFQKTEGSL